MIQVNVKIPPQLKGGLGQGSDSLFRRSQMERLAQYSRDVVVARTRSGFGSDDAPMPPLKGGNKRIFLARVNGRATFASRTYAVQKLKAGLQGFRDMWGTGKQGGHMLDNLTVRSVSDYFARIALTTQVQRKKAIANEKKTPFLSFSDSDTAKIVAFARQLFNDNVRALGSGWEAVRRLGKRAA